MNILKGLACGLLAALAATASVDEAEARMACGKRDAIVEQLEAKYGETRSSYGLSQGKGVVEVYSNPDTGTWTVLITNAQGTACLMAAGEAWQADSQKTAAGAPV
ncbi:MAG: hypothetical protein AAF713_00310 [Pseudomonadota bacterium]